MLIREFSKRACASPEICCMTPNNSFSEPSRVLSVSVSSAIARSLSSNAFSRAWLRFSAALFSRFASLSNFCCSFFAWAKRASRDLFSLLSLTRPCSTCRSNSLMDIAFCSCAAAGRIDTQARAAAATATANFLLIISPPPVQRSAAGPVRARSACSRS